MKFSHLSINVIEPRKFGMNKKKFSTYTKNKKDLGNMNWLDFKENFIETIKYSMPKTKGTLCKLRIKPFYCIPE